MDIPDPPASPSNEPESEENRTSYRYYLQLAASLVTLVVAVSAILLSVWEGYEMRRHNRLSVLPHVQVDITQLTLDAGEQVSIGGTRETLTERTYFLGITLENTGLGPAVFEKALLFRPGSAVPLYRTTEDEDHMSLYQADSLLPRTRDVFPKISAFTGEVRQGRMMRDGARQKFFEATIPASSVPDTVTTYPPRRLRDLLSQYSFVVCYCSVYGENCGMASIGAAPPEDACSF